jgi:hypothetical protein
MRNLARVKKCNLVEVINKAEESGGGYSVDSGVW